MTQRRFAFAASLGCALLLAGCENEVLNSPDVPPYVGGAMFQGYVAMGNSITAGFQSGGINDSTQRQSYAVLMGGAMRGNRFYYPSLRTPGCPPPIDTLFTATGVPHTLGGPLAPACSLRSATIPPYLSNVAVPGATSFDPFSTVPTISSNALTQLILGGRSQVEAAAAARPTFVSVWIGNNDVLGAATDTANAGTPLKVTPVALFTLHYDSMLSVLDTLTTLQGGVLIGVADVAAIPYFSYGQVYFGAFVGGQLPANMTVLANCAPSGLGGIGDTVLVPFRYGFGLIGAARAGVKDTLDCTNDHSIQPGELANLHATVVSYNNTISARATARNWAYFDPNAALAALRVDTSQVAIFPHAPPDTASVTRPFGRAFSRDGVHPSATTHKLIANALIQVINAKYGSAIPNIP